MGYHTQVFYKAIEKYGWDNFDHIILADCLTKKEADETERYWIKKWKTNKKENGYNISSGGEKRGTTHGMTDSKIYRIHRKMLNKCYLPSNKLYSSQGGIGITVYEDWKNFENFYTWALSAGYQDGMFLHRKDLSKNYMPDNCYWSYENPSYRFKSEHFYTYNGKTQSLMEWADELGVCYSTLRSRIVDLHMDVAQAFEMPPVQYSALTYKGETHTMAEWSRILGIKVGTINSRYKQWGENPEKILGTPIQYKKKESNNVFN